MLKRKCTIVAGMVMVFLFCFSFNYASAASLKEGMRSSSVTELQKNLKQLGFLSCEPTGYFGNLTESAVKKLQAKHGLAVDGKAGVNTLGLIKKLTGAQITVSRGTEASRQNPAYKGLLTPWFGGVEKVFYRGCTANVYDIASGLSFNVKRTYGYNHADCEPLTANDTQIMKKIYGGSWSWSRRAVIVTVGGQKIAASMAGMPHAGVESKAANITVSSRSGGYGRGVNLDTVKKNSMSGHFDIHFLGSKTHGTSRVDANHQAAVKKAAKWAEEN